MQALLLTYLVRVAITLVLIAAAPIVLMFHALPHDEGIARWWWKAITACLAIQVAESMVVVIAVRLFLAPSGDGRRSSAPPGKPGCWISGGSPSSSRASRT